MILHIGAVTTTEPTMKPAYEHPETAETLFDVALAYIAVGFVAAAFGVPYLLAAIR